MSLLESVGTYLASQGHGTLATNLFLGLMPSSPDACVTVYEFGSGAPLETMGSAPVAVEVLGLQVIVRGSRDDYPTARDKALNIRTLLASVTETALSGVHVHRISAETWPIPLGNDDLDRPQFSVRFRAMIRP